MPGVPDPDARWLRRVLLAAGAFLYLAFALVTPPFQTPDEHQHLYRAWQLAHFQLHGERHGERAGGMVPAGLVAAAVPEIGNLQPNIPVRPVPVRPVREAFGRATPWSDSQPRIFADFLGAVIYSPAGYVPQIVAVWTGGAVGLSVEATVRLGRVLNAALTLALFLLAFRLMPWGRLFVLLLALMPMTAAMAASLGQDGLVLGTSALAVAIALRARQERRWTRATLALLGLAGAILALTKIVYLPLLLLALFPIPRGADRLRWLAVPLLLSLVSGALAFAWLHSNAGAVIRHAPGIPDPGGQMAFIASNPAALVYAMVHTATIRSGWILMSTFNFGWMTVGPVKAAAALAGGAAALAWWQGESRKPERAWRSWAALVALLTAGAVAAAMYIGSTPLRAPVILGLQGRYFLPLLPIPLLAAMRLRRAGSGLLAARLSLLLLGGANVAALGAIAAAFYTV